MRPLLLVAVLSASVAAQAPDTLVVALEARPEVGPFTYLAGSAEPLGAMLGVTGAPDSLAALRLYGEPVWVPGANLLVSAVWAVGRTSGGGYALVVDTDGDRDLANERAVLYPEVADPAAFRAAQQAVEPVRVEVRVGPVGHAVDLWPLLYVADPNGQVWTDEAGDPVYFVEVGGHRAGEVTVRGTAVPLALGHRGRAGRYDHEETQVLVGDDPQPYAVTDVLPLAGEGYRVVDVTPGGERLTLVRVPEGPPHVGLRVGQIAPDFAAVTVSGDSLRLADLRGRFVLLEFWGTWCRPCVQNAPVMAEAFARYGGDRFTIVGLAYDEPEAVAAFTAEHGHTWPQIAQPDGGDQSVLAAYAVEVYPTPFLLDPEGRIVTQEGLTGPELLDTLARVLDEQAAGPYTVSGE